MVRYPAVMQWPADRARALLAVVEGIGAEGLKPADYKPDALRAAIAQGPGPALDAAASQSFTWLVEDLRDGRTPMEARKQWFVVDPDADLLPTGKLMTQALASGDVAGTLALAQSDQSRLRRAARCPGRDARGRRQASRADPAPTWTAGGGCSATWECNTC